MRLTAIQLPARHGAPEAQLELLEELLAAGPRTDLVLLPEASLTGYVSSLGDFDLRPFAEAVEGPTRAALCRLAARFDCLMVGPIIEREREREQERERARCFNSIIGVTPDGETLFHYRKRHPWFPESWASAGPAAGSGALSTWRGLTLTAAICFDIHFLVADAAEALAQADLLLFPSAWVDDVDSRPALLSPIAASHRIAILNANWGPGEPRLSGQGGSLFIDERGAQVARLDSPAGRLDVAIDP